MDIILCCVKWRIQQASGYKVQLIVLGIHDAIPIRLRLHTLKGLTQVAIPHHRPSPPLSIRPAPHLALQHVPHRHISLLNDAWADAIRLIWTVSSTALRVWHEINLYGKLRVSNVWRVGRGDHIDVRWVPDGVD